MGLAKTRPQWLRQPVRLIDDRNEMDWTPVLADANMGRRDWIMVPEPRIDDRNEMDWTPVLADANMGRGDWIMVPDIFNLIIWIIAGGTGGSAAGAARELLKGDADLGDLGSGTLLPE